MDRTRTIFVAILGVTAVTILAVFFLRPQPDPVVDLVGSEKIPFFQDERVQEALRDHGLEVTVQKAGSREIATDYDLSQYDFVFPAGIPAAQKIQQEHNVSTSYKPFFTPMVIASWQPIADLFVQQGIATDEGGYYLLDMEKLHRAKSKRCPSQPALFVWSLFAARTTAQQHPGTIRRLSGEGRGPLPRRHHLRGAVYCPGRPAKWHHPAGHGADVSLTHHLHRACAHSF